MRSPTCPKCGSSSFEIGPIQIKNARYQHNAIMCSSCGCVVGLEEATSLTYMLSKLAEKLDVRFDL